ncbi:hypothetical protein L1049_011991 [Liquidambar formosana]|uniref:Uncharacterized protein n=1 Tax=Liquidambar formosana TaxID=63359 RepID=A0AAP0RXG0_LIQFO
MISLRTSRHPLFSAPHSASSFEKGETSGSRNKSGELMPQEAPGRLDGVLDALQQAKLSLQHKLNRFPLLEGGSVGQAVETSVHVMRASDKVEIPVGWDGLFKVPTDFKFEPTTQANFLSSGSRSSLPNYYPDMGIAVTAGDRFLPSPYLETRSSISSSDRFFPSPYMERRLGGSSSDRFLTSPYALGVSSNDRFLTSSPYMEMGSRVSTQKPYSDPYLDTGLPSSSRFIHTTYPSFGEQMPRMPTDVGFSRSVPSRAGGIPPADNFSFYNDQLRPNMYR